MWMYFIRFLGEGMDYGSYIEKVYDNGGDKRYFVTRKYKEAFLSPEDEVVWMEKYNHNFFFDF